MTPDAWAGSSSCGTDQVLSLFCLKKPIKRLGQAGPALWALGGVRLGTFRGPGGRFGRSAPAPAPAPAPASAHGTWEVDALRHRLAPRPGKDGRPVLSAAAWPGRGSGLGCRQRAWGALPGPLGRGPRRCGLQAELRVRPPWGEAGWIQRPEEGGTGEEQAGPGGPIVGGQAGAGAGLTLNQWV